MTIAGTFQLHRLQSAVDLARDADALAVDRKLRGERALRPAEQRGEHLPGLIAIVVDRLLAHDDEAGLFLLDDTLEDFRNRERLDDAVDLHQDPAVGAHRERGADGLGRLLRADRHRDDLGRGAFLLQPDRLFDRDLVERIHRHLDVGKLDAGTVRLDANLDVEIDHPLDGHQYFHASKLPPGAAGKLWPTPGRVNAIPSAGFPRITAAWRRSRRPDACIRTARYRGGGTARSGPRRPPVRRRAPTKPCHRRLR